MSDRVIVARRAWQQIKRTPPPLPAAASRLDPWADAGFRQHKRRRARELELDSRAQTQSAKPPVLIVKRNGRKPTQKLCRRSNDNRATRCQ